MNAEGNLRPTRASCAPDACDSLPPFDDLPFGDEDAVSGHVEVDGKGAIAMPNPHEVAPARAAGQRVGLVLGDGHDFAAARCPQESPEGRPEIQREGLVL